MHTAPPPLTRGARETFRGSAVIEELQGPRAVALWDLLRSLLLWVDADPAERAGLFASGAAARRAKRVARALDGELRGPAEAICAALGSPAEASPARVADACREISAWAVARGCTGTALSFMQAAALADTSDAEAAYLTGRLARGRAEGARAEGWFGEALLRSHRGGDPAARALAIIGLGNLHLQRGNLPAAERAQTRALRLARRHGLRSIEGMASHDLFVIADERGETAAAVEHAERALAAYGPGHPRLPSLAHDVAVFWMNCGAFAPALELLGAVLPLIRGPRERLLTLGSLARAAGAEGDRETFERAREGIAGAVRGDGAPPGEGAGPALLALAQGAASLGEWERARAAAGEALRVGEARREGKVVIAAEALAAAAAARAEASAGPPRPPLEPPHEVLRTLVEYLGEVPAPAA